MKPTFIILTILIAAAIVSLLFITGSGIYFTWFYEPEIATEISDKDLAIITELYDWWMRVKNWEYQQKALHIDKLIQREVIKFPAWKDSIPEITIIDTIN